MKPRAVRVPLLLGLIAVLAGCASLIPEGESNLDREQETAPPPAREDEQGSGPASAPDDQRGRPEPEPGEQLRRVPVRTLSQGLQSAVRIPVARAITEPDAFAQVWAAITANDPSRPPLPQVDFAEETVLVVLLGERPTAGFASRVVDVQLATDIAQVRLQLIAPAPGAMVAQVVTTPFLIAAIPVTGVEVVFTGDPVEVGFLGD